MHRISLRFLVPIGAVLTLGLSTFVLVLPTLPDASTPPVTIDNVDLTPATQTVTTGWHAQTDTTANMVGVSWQGKAPADFTVEKRDPRGHWHSLAPVGLGDDPGADPGSRDAKSARRHAATRSTEPVWVGNDTTAVRVKLDHGTATNVDLKAIKTPRVATSPPGSADALPAWPNIISRAQWGADEGLRLANCSSPDYDARVQLAIVHHTVNSNSYQPWESASIVRGVYAYHTITLGYCDIAYNFLVDRFGQVFEGRFGGVDRPVHGAHAIGFNTQTTGVAAIGNFQGAGAPGALIDGLENIIAWKLAASGVDPARPTLYTTNGNDKFAPGTQIWEPTVIGHRDTWFTDCPGDGLYGRLDEIHAPLAARVITSVPDPSPWWVPGLFVPSIATLDAFGGVHPAGSADSFHHNVYWPNFPIARAVKLATGGGGYVLDGFGAVNAFGNAPPATASAYWPGWDIARDLVLRPAGGGWVLDGWGAIHAFGGAPPITSGSYWQGWDIARGLVVFPSGAGGYVLDGWGGVHPFGNAGAPGFSGYWPGWDIARSIVWRSDDAGGYVLDGYGSLHAFAGAPPLANVQYLGFDFAASVALTPGGGGGYVVDRFGQLYPFGNAPWVRQAQTGWGFSLGRGVSVN